MGDCSKWDLSVECKVKTVTLSCRKCNASKELPSVLYFQKWGYPKGREEIEPHEWLHQVNSMVICPYCKMEAEFKTSKEFYGTDYGTNVWACEVCNAYVGTHGKGRTPKGTLANKETRQWRIEAHKYVDPLWKGKDRKMSRSQVYLWIQKVMEMTPQEAHIGNFNVEQCKAIIRKVGEEMIEKFNITFIDISTGTPLGSSVVPNNAIKQLKIGDKIEFQPPCNLFGMYEIVSFAVNEGHPEGNINLKPFKLRGTIKLQQYNEELLDSILPF